MKVFTEIVLFERDETVKDVSKQIEVKPITVDVECQPVGQVRRCLRERSMTPFQGDLVELSHLFLPQKSCNCVARAEELGVCAEEWWVYLGQGLKWYLLGSCVV